MRDRRTDMNQQAENTLALGIDIGSTTAKVVLVENGKIIYEKSQRQRGIGL